MWQMAAEGQSGRMVCDMEVHQSWIPPRGKNGTNWYSLTLAERCWRPNSRCEHCEVVGSEFQLWQQWRERQAMFQRAVHSCHTTKWRASQSAHPCESADYDQATLHGAEYQLKCIGNDGADAGVSKNLRQVGPTDSHTGKERSLYASFSVLIEPICGRRWQFPGSSLVIRWRCCWTTTSWNQNDSPWSDDMWIPHRIKCSKYSPQWVKWRARGDPYGFPGTQNKPSTLTTALQH